MNIKLVFLLIFSTVFYKSWTQENNLSLKGEGHYHPENIQCITDEERQKVNQEIKRNIKKYNIKLPKQKSMPVLYDWPIDQNPAYSWNSTIGISNYVDHNTAFPNQLEDYNCGTHTYDTNGGYNHQGIDIFLWPFDHNQVANDHTYAVAGAAGTILAKQDGQVDNSCTLNNNPANYVILEHSDGSRSWYWHLKNGSVTTKPIGSSVVSGEYLGVIASSGNSTGPHLHFECYDENLNLIDPYSGSCNSMNSSSFWNAQKPYWEPTINVVMTHAQPPNLTSCPNPEITNEKTVFNPLDTVYLIPYFHDYQTSNTSNMKVRYPNGAIWYNWNHTPNMTYRASYYWWYIIIPSSAALGTYAFEVTLNGTTVSADFEVESSNCPPDYTGANQLTGTQNVDEAFETNGILDSDQIINSNAVVKYDSAVEINLLPGFQTILGVLFEAIIDGCGGAAKEENGQSGK